MRIISGIYKSRKLAQIKGDIIRPTSDKARESIFNVLSNTVRDAVVLDLFAGTGALGLEALSRHAASAIFVDQHPMALSAIAKNIHAFGLNEQATVIKWNVETNLKCLKKSETPFTLVFMDPPYRKNLIPGTLTHLENSGKLAQDAIIVVEHAGEEQPADCVGHFLRDQTRKYGKSFVSFLRYTADTDASHNGEK